MKANQLAGKMAVMIIALGAIGAQAHPRLDILELDSDGDGQVSFDEFQLPEREQRRSLLERADTDEDGAVSRDEMLAAISTISEERRAEVSDRALQRFDSMDADGNGVVTPDEVRMQMFARIDADGDGLLTQAEVDAMREQRREGRGRRHRQSQSQSQS